MGLCVAYSAIPPTSNLYTRILNERAFSILVQDLFSYGCGILRFFEIEPREVNEIFEFTIQRNREVFGSDLEASLIIAEFRSELRHIRQAYPGIEDRHALLEKRYSTVAECLSRELSRRQITKADDLTDRLMSGDQTFPPGLPVLADCLRLISPELVKEGASFLRQIEPEMLVPQDEIYGEWMRERIEPWRDLYLSAAENGEAMLVGFN